MASAALPPTLDGRLADFLALTRRRQLLRGAGSCVLRLVLPVLALLVFDAGVSLPTAARGGLLAGWLLWAAYSVYVTVLRPWRQPIDANTAAALIERSYPELGERLSSAVELCAAADSAHGAPHLIALLVRETEIRARGVDFRAAVPFPTAHLLAGGAALCLLLALVPALVWPGKVNELARRFFLPGYVPAVAPTYRVVVNPGDTAVARGQAVTLAIVLERLKPDAELPTTATLIVPQEPGEPLRLGMTPDANQPHVFFLQREFVKADFTYRVEAGTQASPTYTVLAIDPVELEPGQPAITITAPAYARPQRPERTVNGFDDLNVLQHSQLVYHFRFTRPAEAAWLEWTPRLPNRELATQRIKLPLSADRRATLCNLPVVFGGTLKLVMEAEYHIRTEVPAHTVTAQPDQPPTFGEVTGLLTDGRRRVRPDEVLNLRAAVRDDVAITQVELEYAVNREPAQTKPLTLTGAGTEAVVAELRLPLKELAATGATLRLRLKATDNRQLPAEQLEPQASYYPPNDEWAILELTDRADSLEQQDTLARFADVQKRLEAVRQALTAQRRQVQKLYTDSGDAADLTTEQQAALKQLQTDLKQTEQKLRDLVKAANSDLDLRPVADRAATAADTDVADAHKQLAEAGTDSSAGRQNRLAATEKDLMQALKRLADADELNNRLALDKLDRQRLKQLAEQQEALAQQEQPSAAEQAELEKRLHEIEAKSAALRADAAARQAEAEQKLALEAKTLAEAQRQLTEAQQASELQRKQRTWAGLADKQRELAEAAEKLADETNFPARLAKKPSLDAQDARKATDLLDQGQGDAAVPALDKAARDLDRLARDLEQAATQNREPRMQAQQLSRLQNDLRERLADATRNGGEPPAELFDDLKDEQDRLRKATRNLNVPPAQAAARAEIEQAETTAAERLSRHDTAGALAAMNTAREGLQRLAERMPTAAERQQQARQDLARLRAQHDSLSKQIEAASKQPASAARQKQLADLAKKATELAEQLNRLDAPGHEEAVQAARQAAGQSVQDLTAGHTQDLPADQQALTRALDRLDQGLTGRKTNVQRVRELAQMERALADQAASLGTTEVADRLKLVELLRQQQEVGQSFKQVVAPEAPQRLAEAGDALRQAENAGRDPGKYRTAAQTAATALDRLADQLAGKETPAAQAERLAKRQAEVAEQAKRGPIDRVEQGTRTQQLLDEIKQLRTDAADTKQQATEAVQKLAQDRGSAAQQQAADALRQLADQVAQQKPAPATDPATQAKRLAALHRRQAELTRVAKPAQLPSQAEEQTKLQQQLQQLPAGPAPQEWAQAQAGQEQAQQHLANKEGLRAANAQSEVASALERYATRVQANPSNPGGNAPRPEQIDKAKQLAQAERELQQQVQQAAPEANQRPMPMGNPLGDLPEQQERVAQATEQLARDLAQQQGEGSQAAATARQAAAAAQKAGQQAQAGGLPAAQQAGQQAGQMLQRLAQSETGATAQQTAELAKQQEAINGKLAPLANDANAQAGQQQQRQANLRERTERLAQEMQKLAQQPDANGGLKQASALAKEAEQAMRAAQHATENAPGQARMAAEKAAQALEQAAKAAPPTDSPPHETGTRAAAKQVQAAGEQMQAAQKQIGQQPGAAKSAMQQAASALKQAAQQLGQNQPDGQPNDGRLASATGPLGNVAALPPELKPHAGKSWGELPGELRTKLMQDLRAKYGDDYARVIKLYFEQLAERK